MKEKIVIFSASTGQGHNQVAKALQIELIEKNYEVLIIEPLKEVGKVINSIVSDGYKVLATKAPKMYGTIYKISNNEFINKPIAKIFIKVLKDKIEEILHENNASLVISTHPLIVKVMCSIKEERIIDIPFISVVTDYLPHQSYISHLVDAYIVGSIYTKKDIIVRGIHKDRVYVHGIPIKREFHEDVNITKKDDKFTILLMGGSMGVNAIKKALKNLFTLPKPLKIIVVCGNNEQLKKTIQEKYLNTEPNKEVEILGFVDNIPELMELSDVIITKPGGLTVTEALAKNIPMIIPYFIPGQEKENAEVLVDAGAAIKIDSIKELNEVVEKLMIDSSMMKMLKENMNDIAKDHSLDDAIELCISLITSYSQKTEMRNARQM